MKENNSNNITVFKSLPDKEKIKLLNSMIEEYKDSPKIIKILEEMKSGIQE